MAKLGDYRRKRDPKRTPEPFGGRARGAAPLFVIQRHDARRLHYDLRLERDGALASWAVPKGLPMRAGERHLAVHVEDHPLDYATFEGVIPQGEYGAGTVEIWDRGTYEVIEEKRGGGLTFRLDGERAQGVWTLVPAHLDGKEQNWLLLRKDAAGSTARSSARSSPRRPRRCPPATAGSTSRSGTAIARSSGSREERRRSRAATASISPSVSVTSRAPRRAPSGPRLPCSTARSARSTSPAAPVSRRCRAARAGWC